MWMTSWLTSIRRSARRLRSRVSLLLPEGYRHRALLAARGVGCLSEHEAAAQPRRARVGIINLMPEAQRYEALLLTALGAGPTLVEPVWIRLKSHVYGS